VYIMKYEFNHYKFVEIKRSKEGVVCRVSAWIISSSGKFVPKILYANTTLVQNLFLIIVDMDVGTQPHSLKVK